MIKHPFTIHPDLDGGYTIIFPDLIGCWTVADTDEEVLPMARDAYRQWTDYFREQGWVLPEPTLLEPGYVDDRIMRREK